MKKKLFPIFILIICNIFNITSIIAQTISWTNQIGGNQNDYGGSGSCDNEGNYYFAGGFESDFCYFQTDTLVRHGINDLFLVKYDPSGKELWVRQIGGWNAGSYESITVHYNNVSNYIFISGSFYGDVSFGSCILTSDGGLDIFLLKYDLDGNCLWAKKAGGAGDDKSQEFDFDKDGNIYMCGSNSLSANFGGILITKGGFLAKFNQDGNCLWAKNKFGWAPIFNSKIRQVGLKVSGTDIIIGGCMSVDDTVNIDTIFIAHKGFGSSLICCFDSIGIVKWIKEGISRATETISNLVVDGNGDIIQTGYFVDTINFSGNTLTSKSGIQEMFLVKYGKTGKFKWAKQTSGTSFAEGFNLSTNGSGNVNAVGHFSGTVHFGDFQIKSKTNEDMFLAGYDSLGNCLGVYNYGNGSGSGICQDMIGNLYFTFLFNLSTSLDSMSFVSNGNIDIILAKCSAITGIEEPKSSLQNHQLLIYSNPNPGKCNITIPVEFITEKQLTLQIFDTQGKLVKQAPVEKTNGKIKLNIEALAKGSYTAILSNGKKSYPGKIIFR